MNDIHDVTAYIIDLATKTGEAVTNMKLQKLVYYSFVWYAVENGGQRLFKDPIFAWKYGPVVIPAYDTYESYGADSIKEIAKGNKDKISAKDKDLIEEVFQVYGNKSAIELLRLTHSERPWMDTFDPSYQKTEIPLDLIVDYYTKKKDLSED